MHIFSSLAEKLNTSDWLSNWSSSRKHMVSKTSSLEILCSLKTTALVIFKVVLELLLPASGNSTVKSVGDMLTHLAESKAIWKTVFATADCWSEPTETTTVGEHGAETSFCLTLSLTQIQLHVSPCGNFYQIPIWNPIQWEIQWLTSNQYVL